MSWNYRVIRSPSGHLAVHEVFYDPAGTVDMWTAEPATFECDADEGVGGILQSLQQALHDATRLPILDEIDLTSRRDAGPSVPLAVQVEPCSTE